ncbi:hypothetical protein GC163_13940 [bacterium]|nr:hypothetical protein [bacterium]
MRAFIGNFDFEHQLARPGSTLSSQLRRLNAELATSWLAIADDGDILWTPESIEQEFWEQCASVGLPRLQTVTQFADIPADAELVPWGWTSALSHLAQQRAQIVIDPQIIRRANSRRWSMDLEQSWNVGLEGSQTITDLSAVETAVAQFPGLLTKWVIKAEFGMSGRERLLGYGPLTAALRPWFTKRQRADGVVFFEPWVQRIAEAGILFDIVDTGVQFVGVAEMLPTSQGQYAGSIFHQTDSAHDWSPAIEIATQAAERLHQQGYRGPLGIDAMWYRDDSGAVRCRPLQDVNARWTMGRLALGWRRHFTSIRFGYWWLGSRTAWERGDHLSAARSRGYLDAQCQVLRTSPSMICGGPTHHVAAVVAIS